MSGGAAKPDDALAIFWSVARSHLERMMSLIVMWLDISEEPHKEVDLL